MNSLAKVALDCAAAAEIEAAISNRRVLYAERISKRAKLQQIHTPENVNAVSFAGLFRAFFTMSIVRSANGKTRRWSKLYTENWFIFTRFNAVTRQEIPIPIILWILSHANYTQQKTKCFLIIRSACKIYSSTVQCNATLCERPPLALRQNFSNCVCSKKAHKDPAYVILTRIVFNADVFGRLVTTQTRVCNSVVLRQISPLIKTGEPIQQQISQANRKRIVAQRSSVRITVGQ